MAMKKMNKNQASQGKVNIIAKMFEMEQDVAPKMKEGSHKPAMQHNNTMLSRQISGQTEVSNTHTNPEMALQSGRGACPMVEQRDDHVMQKKATQPIEAQKPETTENNVGGSHL